ncbi:MAG TPA: cysteine desulfurase family protein [Candidatus Binatia bacterium]|nr:cysteine desulfurase family protein [Candidatus Binatia bacterium]
MATYLDASATTPLDPRVKDAMEPYLSSANPSSLHEAGQHAHEAVESARMTIARFLKCLPNEVFFTSGGTESINAALKGAFKASKKKHLIITAIEHHAVLETAEYLKKHEGVEVTIVPVGKNGIVSAIEDAIRPETLLISVIFVNNELGTIQPVAEIGKIAHNHNILFHVDACQAGLLDLNVRTLNIDLLTLNASKLNGPKGAGLLYCKSGVKLVPLLHGGGQEHGMRSGTENVPAIVGFAKALEIAQSEKEKETMRLFALQTKLEEGLKSLGGVINCADSPRVPSITSVTFKGVEAESFLLRLSEKGVFISTGSACATKSLEPSHVLLAIGMKPVDANSTVRFSLSRMTTEKDIESALAATKDVLQQLRVLVH